VIDITCRLELRPHSELIALLRDHYLDPDRDNEMMLLAYPYLGSGVEFSEKVPGTASWLKNIHLFTFGATMSFGPSRSSINAMKFAVPHLVNAITKDLFLDDINSHFRSLKRMTSLSFYCKVKLQMRHPIHLLLNDYIKTPLVEGGNN